MYTVRIHFYAVRYESNYAGLFIIAGDNIKYKKHLCHGGTQGVEDTINNQLPVLFSEPKDCLF